MPDTDKEPSSLQLLVSPERAAIVAGAANTLRALVRVQAPDLPSHTSRDALHLALVVDRSGSMSGAPLEEAKRCARHVVEQLGARDRACIIAFDDEVAQLAPLTAGSEKAVLRAAIDGIDSGGSTDLHGGWRAGADELAAKLAPLGVHRVILLSDGEANAGLTDIEVIAGQCRDLTRRGVTTSTYGLGRRFNEDLMVAMSKSGRGNAYYGQTAADLAEPFAAEFALLTNLCARGLVLKVNAADTMKVRMRNQYEPAGEDSRVWKLPDLAYAAEAWAVIELELPAYDELAGASLELPVTVSIAASGRNSAPVFLMATLPSLKVVTPADMAALPANDLVTRRVLEIDAADVLSDVRAAVMADDWNRAQSLLEAAEQRFAGHEWAAAIVATMRRLVAQRDARLASKEALFSSNRMSSRLTTRMEPRFCVMEEDAVPAFLRRKPEQGKGKSGSDPV